jgi:prevent-host-death family protein
MKMLKTISAMKIRQNLGQVMNEVAIRGDEYVIERAGKPMVAIIPMEKYRKLQRDLDEFYAEVEEFQASSRNADPQEVDQAINEAVAAAKKTELKQLLKTKKR